MVITNTHFKKWPEVFAMTSTTTSKTISVLQETFARSGILEQLVSDNGPQLVSEKFEIFLSRNGVKHICTSPYHPASNGAAERLVYTDHEASTPKRI